MTCFMKIPPEFTIVFSIVLTLYVYACYALKELV